MKIGEALDSLKEKFSSGNDIPIERATITREEFEAIMSVFDTITDALGEPETSPMENCNVGC